MPTSRVFAIAIVVCTLCATAIGGGIDAESNTDGFDPAAESYRIGEARRRNLIARQLDLIYQMQWENPYFLGEGPIRQPIGYESKQTGPNRWTYRPIYAEDVDPAKGELPAPQAAPPLPAASRPPGPAPADARPEDFIPPQAAPRQPAARAPREF